MKPFDYNKYIKNNLLLKEADEKAPWEKFRKPEDNPNTLLGLLQKQYPNFPFQKYRKKSGKYDIPMSVWNREVGLTPQELQKITKQANAMGLANTWNVYGDPKRAQYMTIDINDPRRPMPSVHGTFWNPDAEINEDEDTQSAESTIDDDMIKEFTDDPQAEEDAETFVSTPEGNKAVATLKSFISRPYEDEELQDLLNMLKLTREQFLTVAQVAGMKLKSGWGGITIKDRNYKGTTPYIEYVPDTRKWWVG